MEEEDKDRTLKVGEKPSAAHPLTAKPRPVPRPRNQPKGATIAQNAKPDKLPPKPVILPKPRRPPPNAPSEKPASPNECVVINNNEVAINKAFTETNKKILSSSNFPPSEESINNIEAMHTENGPAEMNSVDDQWYEPLRPRTESASSSSDNGYEDMPTIDKNKNGQATVPRADVITPSLHHKTSGVNDEPMPSPPPKASGIPGKPSPPVPRKINSTASKNSPPTPRKINSSPSKTSPPVPRKISGTATKTSPQCPPKASDTRQREARGESENITENINSAARAVDSHSASDKSKPLPPKKPLPSLPKGMVPPGQKPPAIEAVSSKPPLPHKPAPDLASSSSTDTLQPSVAALAQKLSTIPVFPFSNTGKAGGIFPSPGTSPRASPHSSPRPSPRNPPSSSSPEKSDSKVATGMAKSTEFGKPKLLPRPGASPQKSSSQPASPRLGQETPKHPPVRPSPPSAEAVARVRSRTVESLEDKESHSGDDTGEIDGPVRKSSLPDRRKQRLAIGLNTRRLGVKHPSTKSAQANRRPPPLPPGAAPVTEKTPSLKVPPLPAMPRPRPFSAYDQTQGVPVRPTVSKSVSVGDIPRVATAEDQSEYAYAYEHTYLGESPPKRSLSAGSPPSAVVDESDGTYVAPDESVVNEFMEDIHGKSSSMTYEVADEQSVAGFMDSLKKKQTLNGMPADLSTDTESESSDSDDHGYLVPPVEESEEEEDDDDDHDDASSEQSFSSNSSHEYCVPPENISPPEPPPHEKDFDEMESIYVEPIHKPDDVFSSDDDKDSVSEEPLYQVYTRCTLQRERNLSRRRLSSDMSLNDEASLEELTKGTLRNMRMLWCELPEVIASGVLDIMKPDERKRQEAMFEVITSEASYLRSLNILMSHFINSDELCSGSSLCVLERGQSHVLFSNISAIKSVSESFLQALRARQKDAVVISSISDILLEYASKYFDVYVKYCSNQIYQDRALKNLRKSVRFLDAVAKLQSSKKAQGLTLQSFLVLPMQRITRLPLLVNAICHRCEAGSEEYTKTDRALAAINKIVNDCNEGARKMERMEEICVLQTQIEFKTKPLALATPARYLLRRGDLMQVVDDSRNPLKRLRPKFKPVYMFLFNDLFLLAKKKSENRYVVLDYATRNMTQVDEPQDPDINVDHMFSLVLLENSESKTKEFLMAGNTETDKTRWMEAFKPPAAEQEGETVYASWDCPQVNALHNYTAQQPDELSLYEGDVINVLKKLRDGWYHGERLCDGTQGWFPANHTEEILNEHVRARNLRQRYRLLAASKHLIGGTLRI